MSNVGTAPRERVTVRKRRGAKRARRILLLAIILAPALYFLPYPSLVLIACGVADVRRHRRLTAELLEKYFTGNGMLTWALSPINLLADALAARNPGIHRLSDLPAGHQAEIETCVRAFVENRDAIRAHVARLDTAGKRMMLTFKWYGANQQTGIRVAEFETPFRHVKTIAVSVFRGRERTSWHFGPLRLMLRVLYNLDPAASNEVFISVDDRVHVWRDDPLLIFDDTFFHQSVNNVDQIRYCLFLDIVRPNRLPWLFNLGVALTSAMSGSFKQLFYKHWSFIR